MNSVLKVKTQARVRLNSPGGIMTMRMVSAKASFMAGKRETETGF